ncbi:MAG: Fe2+-dependent dioxygenase [Geminicoccaceae bacterium]|nr:Fe2+-dependent dioxygenase [Geminicoccaceae bacterium]MCB9945800.1 Fe2+-dependent dioxygenase [Geminicoccaceae bacterium]
MFVTLGGVLNSEEMAAINSILSKLEFRDGRATAGWHARMVKDNDQAAPSAALRQVQDQIVKALERHPMFRSLALPRRIMPPIISRYANAQNYGNHIDDAIMGQPPMRTDLSCTLFLTEPDTYDGGDLVAVGRDGEEAVRLPAGNAVIYPSTTLHRVEPVTRGVRMVAVTWIQSMVRDAAIRDILLDLEQARQMVFERQGKSTEFDLLSRARSNLLRHSAEP